MSAERIVHVAPLGLRFWDEAAGAIARDALRVTAAPLAMPTAEREATRSPSGAYVFHALRELERFARGEAGTDRSAPIAATRPFVVRVTHERGELLPVRFLCDAPQWGFARPRVTTAAPRALTTLSPYAEAPTVPLFASATHPVRPGLASLRAELRVGRVGPPTPFRELAPAAWALVEVSHGATVVGRGLADAKGRALVAFPQPPLALSETVARWAVTVAVYHVTAAEVPERADLDAVVASPSRACRSAGGGPFAPTLTRELRANQVLDLGALELQP